MGNPWRLILIGAASAGFRAALKGWRARAGSQESSVLNINPQNAQELAQRRLDPTVPISDPAGIPLVFFHPRLLTGPGFAKPGPAAGPEVRILFRLTFEPRRQAVRQSFPVGIGVLYGLNTEGPTGPHH